MIGSISYEIPFTSSATRTFRTYGEMYEPMMWTVFDPNSVPSSYGVAAIYHAPIVALNGIRHVDVAESID